MNKRIFVLIGLMLVAGLLIRQAIHETTQLKQVSSLCDQANRGDFTYVIEHSSDWNEYEYGQGALVECRCLALLETDQANDCGQLVWDAYGQKTQELEIPPQKAGLAFINWAQNKSQGDLVAMLQSAYLGHLAIQKAASQFYSRIGQGQGQQRSIWDAHQEKVSTHLWVRLWIANSWVKVNLAPHYDRIYEQQIPAQERVLQEAWFDLKLRAAAHIGNSAHLVEAADAWLKIGGDPYEINAKKALLMNAQDLALDTYDPVFEMQQMVKNLDAIKNIKLRKNIATRLLIHYSAKEDYAAAKKLYDQLPKALDIIAPEDLAPQMRSQNKNAGDNLWDGQWEAAFHSKANQKLELWVSPSDEEKNIQAPYKKHILKPGEDLKIKVVHSSRPLRWIIKKENVALQSGTLWPGDAPLSLSETLPKTPSAPKQKEFHFAPSNNSKKLIVLIPDCADWHIIQYGRTLGLLPGFDALVKEGFSGGVISKPAFTAAAMEKIVWPERELKPSVHVFAYQVGAELGGLASVGQNPFSALHFLLPQSGNFFDVMGQEEYSIANMLFAHGGLKAGRHAQLSGPRGQERTLVLPSAKRALNEKESEQFKPLLNLPEKHQQEQLAMMAAQMDMLEKLYQDKEPDILLMRIESLDILTHNLFGDLFRSSKKSSHASLMWVYRYFDYRLGQLMNLLQEDDLLLVVSDHGIETATKHHPRAFFALYGKSVNPGRLTGEPEFQGLAHLIATLMDKETSFPKNALTTQSVKSITAPAQ